jgi:DNA polymerase III epsilon subunit-like protein
MKEFPNFIVVDTEGKESLREIAVIDAQGQLIYEAFAKENPDNDGRPLKVKPLKQILQEFFLLANHQLVVFHSARHDLNVLRQSCYKTGIPYFTLSTDCTFELSQQYLQGLSNYSLEYLSKKLGLKVNNQYFNPEQAHTARYDALFTYQLYCKIQQQKSMNQSQILINPFSSSRVDNPFQDHLDLKSIYQTEFEQLKWIINDIKQDKNHQSKGAVVIGEPGSGKTHLMMRLAKELLQVNRLLFIRHPNNPEAVLYHIYSRILESFVYKIPEIGYTQLEFLLAHSFVKLISHTSLISLNQKDQDIMNAVRNNPLNLYEHLGTETSQKKKSYWEHIEKRTNEWWMSEYGIAGYAPKIIKGIIKFCRYSDRRYKELVTRWLAAEELTEGELELIGLDNWSEELSKEAFSLEAIAVFSKLSLLDEPLIIIFDQLELLGLEQNEILLLNFGEGVKEIFTNVPNSLIILNLFPDRWQQFQGKFDNSIIDRVSQNQVLLNRPTDEKLKEILIIKAQAVGLELEQLFTALEITTILNHGSIRSILNSAAEHYLQKHLPPIIEEIEEENISLNERLTQLEKEFQSFKQLFQNLGQALLEFTPPDPKPDPKPDPTLVQEFLIKNRLILEQDYDKLQIITDTDDVGKFKVITEAFQLSGNFTIDYLRFGKKKLPEHLVIQHPNQRQAIAFLNLDGTFFTNRIKNFNELVILHKDIQFTVRRDRRKNMITGKVGKEEIEKLDNAPNGRFCMMEKEDRLDFELLYKLITDIYNRDLEIDLEKALSIVKRELQNSWLMTTLLDPS